MSLNNDMRQNIQSNLDFSSSSTGEARKTGREGKGPNRWGRRVHPKAQLEHIERWRRSLNERI